MFCMSLTTVKAQADSASIYSNKVYYANIAGDYSAAIAYADSAIVLINKMLPDSLQPMTLANTRGGEPAEITWLHRGFVTNYDVILELRNEVAVAALALHKWELYHYNNRVYTQLYKEISADKSLGDYVRTMQASSQTRTVAVILLVILLVVILLSYYLLYYRQRLYYRYCVEQVEKINRMLFDDISDEEKSQRIAAIDTRKYPDHLREIVKRIAEALKQNITVSKDKNLDIELSIDELHRLEYENQKYYISNNVLDNCLSTLKHETMYYPNRISQLLRFRQLFGTAACTSGGSQLLQGTLHNTLCTGYATARRPQTGRFYGRLPTGAPEAGEQGRYADFSQPTCRQQQAYYCCQGRYGTL